ncbi:Choline-sulfatase [Bremerella volcania]|uniref:Choline-sulfatase n=1 Tax=Bremerella volcania TaxID=2527984 RepID=A0A518C9C4_9BACT|nr:sulfatase [Bremerella volcania]QDU75827.1 Choline-sulfatase [Bremerella volcania]
MKPCHLNKRVSVYCIPLFTVFLMVASTDLSAADKSKKPNILLIAVDDLNDWIGVLGGHPQATTPNIDRLSKKGVLFANAHCQSPVCNPSRASMMSSTYPETSGIYFLNPPFATSPVAEERTMMPIRFHDEGYDVSAAGKLYHNAENKQYFASYAGSFGGFGPLPKKKLSSFKGVKLWDWGVYPERDEQTPDYRIAQWGAQQLKKEFDTPFFLGVGFYRPHVPQYASQKWFDMYPLESMQLPSVPKDDLNDLSIYAINLTRLKHIAPTQDWVSENNQWKPLVQSYLACVSFVDEQVGKVLDALEASPYADNTYIVLFSDHGFHLGEKERWAKRSLWEDSTHVPLIIAGPGIPSGQICKKPVELVDIYPTLLELSGLKPDSRLEGHSLLSLLKNPKADWPHMARTSFGPGNCSIRSERYRFIRYNDGSEEFYDHNSDPHEWNNLISHSEMKTVIEQHRKHLPQTSHPILGEGSTGHKAFHASSVPSRDGASN